MRVLLAGTLAAAKFRAEPCDDGGELLRVLGADLGSNRVFRALRGDGLEDFLQFALGIHVHRLETEVFDIGLGLIDHETSDGLEAAIEVHGAHEGFEGVGEGGGADPAAAGFLALAHHEVTAEADGDGVDLETLAGDEAGAHFGQHPLRAIGEEIEEVLGEDELEDGVAEEFEALIVKMMALGFVPEAGVRKGFRQEEGIAEFVTDACFQRCHGEMGGTFL